MYLPPVGHTIHASHDIFIHLPVASLKKRSSSLPLKRKGKKSRTKATRVDSDPASPLGQPVRVVGGQHPTHVLSLVSQVSHVDLTHGPGVKKSFCLSMLAAPLLSAALIVQPIAVTNSEVPIMPAGL